MTEVTSLALQKVMKGTVEKMSFGRLEKIRRDGADVTWCGRLLHTRAAATGHSFIHLFYYSVKQLTDRNMRTIRIIKNDTS